MTTVKSQPTTVVETTDDAQPACISLADLMARLPSLICSPSLAELNAWMRALDVELDELSNFICFKEANYARHRIVRAEHAELLMICWRPGQRTPIHDHDGSYGTVRVVSGVMWETIFEMTSDRGLAYRTGREWSAGQTTAGADVPDIHEIGNPDISGQNLITLHLYAPPLRSLNVYQVGMRESVFTPSFDE